MPIQREEMKQIMRDILYSEYGKDELIDPFRAEIKDKASLPVINESRLEKINREWKEENGYMS